VDGFDDWKGQLQAIDLSAVSEATGVPAVQITEAAILFVTSKQDVAPQVPEGGFPPGAIFNTVAHQDASQPYGDAERVALACTNLSILTGNVGRAGGGVASLRGPANYQGATDMGATPNWLPGGVAVSDGAARQRYEQAWSNRAAAGIVSLPANDGVALDDLPRAIEAGEVRALWLEAGLRTRDALIDERLYEALKHLDYLVVVDGFNSPYSEIADIVLPLSLNLEKDGTFTSFDRTVQRVRAAVPALGEAHDSSEILGAVADRLGYTFPSGHASQVMSEISSMVPGYSGVTYARLERGGIVTPVERFGEQGATILTNGTGPLHPRMVTLDARETSIHSAN